MLLFGSPLFRALMFTWGYFAPIPSSTFARSAYSPLTWARLINSIVIHCCSAPLRTITIIRGAGVVSYSIMTSFEWKYTFLIVRPIALIISTFGALWYGVICKENNRDLLPMQHFFLTNELDSLVYGGLHGAALHCCTLHLAGQITLSRAIGARSLVWHNPLATRKKTSKLFLLPFFSLPGVTVIFETLQVKIELSTNFHCVRSISAT